MHFLAVAVLSTVEYKAAIIAGVSLHMNPAATILAASMGATLDTLLVLFVGGKIRRWILARHRRTSPRYRWLEKAYNRWGLIGLGLVAPLVPGTGLGTAIGVSLGFKPRQLFLWMTAGTILWSIVLTATAMAGDSVLQHVFRTYHIFHILHVFHMFHIFHTRPLHAG